MAEHGRRARHTPAITESTGSVTGPTEDLLTDSVSTMHSERSNHSASFGAIFLLFRKLCCGSAHALRPRSPAAVPEHVMINHMCEGSTRYPAIWLRPLHWWWVALSGVLVMVTGVCGSWWLWEWLRGLPGPEWIRELLQMVRAVLTATGAAWVALTLLMAVVSPRGVRELLSVLTGERGTSDSWRDAAERRITELYAKAVEQLSSEHVPDRLAGLSTLEQLAQNSPGYRQAVVETICAYLRTPCPHSGGPTATGAGDDDGVREGAGQWSGECQVRVTAQRILASHLRPDRDPTNGEPTNPRFWADIDLDLSGATLHDWDFSGCTVRTSRFTRTTFLGNTGFERATFTGHAWFREATFAGNVRFTRATFAGDAWFNLTTFHRDAWFTEVFVAGDTWFSEATFVQNAWFNRASLDRDAWFAEVAFAGDAWFVETDFGGDAWFGQAVFGGEVCLMGARARVDRAVLSVWPMGWRLRRPDDEDEARLPGKHGSWGFLVPLPSVPTTPPAKPKPVTTETDSFDNGGTALAGQL